MNTRHTPRTDELLDLQYGSTMPAIIRDLAEHARTLERENAEMREALEAMLASAFPHPEANPRMWAAWKKGEAALSKAAGSSET